MTVRFYRSFLPCIAIAWLAVVPLSGVANLAELEVTEAPVGTDKQSRTLKLINYLIDKSHYRKQPLDDDFSALVLRAYLDHLDPGKSIFVQGDIDRFNFLRHRFDDFIRDGAVKPVFDIFYQLRRRVEERV